MTAVAHFPRNFTVVLQAALCRLGCAALTAALASCGVGNSTPDSGRISETVTIADGAQIRYPLDPGIYTAFVMTQNNQGFEAWWDGPFGGQGFGCGGTNDESTSYNTSCEIAGSGGFRVRNPITSASSGPAVISITLTRR
jgi:hypothetical protein